MVAEAPPNSGYARLYFPNRDFSSLVTASYSRALPAPVVLTGDVLLRKGPGLTPAKLPGAGIQAYGIVRGSYGALRAPS